MPDAVRIRRRHAPTEPERPERLLEDVAERRRLSRHRDRVAVAGQGDLDRPGRLPGALVGDLLVASDRHDGEAALADDRDGRGGSRRRGDAERGHQAEREAARSAPHHTSSWLVQPDLVTREAFVYVAVALQQIVFVPMGLSTRSVNTADAAPGSASPALLPLNVQSSDTDTAPGATASHS